MFSKLHSLSPTGTGIVPALVESEILPGPMSMQITGLGDSAVKECRDRIRSAITHAGYRFPVNYIIINLAPNDRPKEGTMTELAIAISLLISSGQLPSDRFNNTIILGSLSLDGSIQAPEGLMTAVPRSINRFNQIIVPSSSLSSIGAIPGVTYYPVSSLKDLPFLIDGEIKPVKPSGYSPGAHRIEVDFQSIQGLAKAKSALAYTAIGRHHTLMIGSPGTGKTMLAQAFRAILPPLSLERSLETTLLHAMAGLSQGELIEAPPFRSPHHTTPAVAMVGGGSRPKPGEVSLAHNGVLFLDELLESRSDTLQALREPMEEGKVTVSRALATVTFPARFTLLAASNPCRCGYLLSTTRRCSCPLSLIQKLYRKLIGPFLDRISIEIETNENDKTENKRPDNTTWWRSKVAEATLRMENRNGSETNGQLSHDQLHRLIPEQKFKNLIQNHLERLKLSNRSLANTLRVAVSIMDFLESAVMSEAILEEAFSLRIANSLQNTLTGNWTPEIPPPPTGNNLLQQKVG